MFTSRGIIKYVEAQVYMECVDKQIALYYRSLIPRNVTLNVPRYAPHITIVRNEPLNDVANWGYYKDQEFEFSYSGNIEHNDTYWWLPVECKIAIEIRKSLKLNEWPPWENGFHMTIGNTK
jgi:hypothetical protein